MSKCTTQFPPTHLSSRTRRRRRRRSDHQRSDGWCGINGGRSPAEIAEHLVVRHAVARGVARVPRPEVVGAIEVEQLRPVDLPLDQDELAADECLCPAEDGEGKLEEDVAAKAGRAFAGEVLSDLGDEVDGRVVAAVLRIELGEAGDQAAVRGGQARGLDAERLQQQGEVAEQRPARIADEIRDGGAEAGGLDRLVPEEVLDFRVEGAPIGGKQRGKILLPDDRTQLFQFRDDVVVLHRRLLPLFGGRAEDLHPEGALLRLAHTVADADRRRVRNAPRGRCLRRKHHPHESVRRFRFVAKEICRDGGGGHICSPSGKDNAL